MSRMIKQWRLGLAAAGITTMTMAVAAFGQVPVKPKTDTSTMRVKLSKDVKVAGGDVALPVAAVNKDSIDREIAAAVQAREATIRADQRRIEGLRGGERRIDRLS